MSNNKKKKVEKKSIWKKMLSNKGTYIALCSVVAVVGFTVYSNQLRNKMENQAMSFDETAWQEAVKEAGEQIEIIELDDDEPVAETAKPLVATAEQKPKTEEKVFQMNFPLDGQIVGKCSLDDLVFCETMEDWRTHNGTDIAAKIGDAVKASEDGVVSRVTQDELLGVVVELDHGNGITSLYGNLQSFDFIKVGTKVKKGDIIGGVGNPGTLEANQGPHLHFEIKEKGKLQNPEEYVKK